MTHPPWCWPAACDAVTGGPHRSRVRPVCAEVALQLREAPGGDPVLHMTAGGREILAIPLDKARLLYRAVRDLEQAGVT